MENQISNTREKNKKPKTGIIVAISTIIIIVLVGVIIFLVLDKSEPKSEPKEVVQETDDGRGILVTPENLNEILTREQVPEGFFETSMTNSWTFINGLSSKDDVYVQNAPSNGHTIYFDLTIDNGERLLYSSPYIPIGMELPQFELTDVPEKGDYNGIVTYHLVDDNNKEISDVSITVTLHIQ